MKILFCFLSVVGIVAVSFLLGRYHLEPGLVAKILASQIVSVPQTWTSTMETVVLQVRLPRIAAALLAGGALSVSGAAYQDLFKNPLVSPAILGVSAGAGFGAALGMVMDVPWAVVQTLAFSFGLLAVFASVMINRLFGNASMIILVLAGLVISALFQALISVIKYVADPMDVLPAITFWLMGGLAKITTAQVAWAVWPILISFAVIYAVRWQINVLSAGEDEAVSLGVNVRRIRMIVIVCATIMTSAAVSISGIIGWVGLLIPHMARMVVGHNFSLVLPASLLMGSTYLLLIDDLGRSATSVELPLGILTALIGAPFFILLLLRIRKRQA